MKVVFRYFKPYDWILIVVLLTLTVLAYLFAFFCQLKNGSTIKITVDGEEFGCYSLSEDREIPVMIDGVVCNTVKIEHGEAFMQNANCPDHLCMHHRKIHSHSQSIVCLPNRVVVTVEGNDDQIDSMVK